MAGVAEMALVPASVKNMPAPVRIAVLVIAAALLAAAVALAPAPINYLVVALVLTAGISLALYGVALRVFERRKIGPFELRLGENAGAAPNQLRDPAARARIDELRSRFEQGVGVFREHGKDMYSIPWYMIVGEPGSGKTEAVRHSGVGFPPGLQDELQGAGGTLNMNWWFTNHAVILDTAGRLLFEDVAPGSTSEWNEFLRLLRAARPTCPVNGLLLVIPADSLVRDTGAEIEEKAGRIAEQLDAIQRQLGVRFPVFVVITKADLINGFREFFDELTDPAVQHQILGWSNPGELDDPFDPNDVERHLTSVRDRLLRRRLRLVGDPPGAGKGEDGGLTRLERADALYAFPDSMTRVAPRLRRYLEMIFVQGEWSTRPLFLRGIYFTSSMREGSALDQDLAEVLGVDVGSLPEGRAWERDRSYFLRDLFLGKVFKECGLVTRAANASKSKRRRQMAVLGAAAAAIVVVGVLTGIGHKQLRESILDRKKFWMDVSKLANYIGTSEPDYDLVYYDAPSDQMRYQGSTRAELLDVSGGGAVIVRPAWDGATIAQLHRIAQDNAASAPEPPAIFRPVAGIWGDPFEQTGQAQRALFERTVLIPLVRLTRSRLAGLDAQSWDDGATEALGEMVRLELDARDVAAESREMLNVETLGAFVLRGEDEAVGALRSGDADTLQGVLGRTYERGGDWPPRSVRGEEGVLARDVREGVETFVAHWSARGGADSRTLAEIEALGGAGTGYERLERDLLSMGPGVLAGDDWNQAYAGLSEARASLRDAWDAGRVHLTTGEAQLAQRVRTEALDAAQGAFQTLLRRLPPVDDETADDALAVELRRELENAWGGLESTIERRRLAALDEVSRLGATLAVDERGEAAFESRFGAIAALDEARSARVGTGGPAEAPERLRAIDAARDRGEAAVAGALGDSAGVGAGRRVNEFSGAALEALAGAQRASVLGATLETFAGGADQIEAFVASRGETLGAIERPSIPLTRMDGGVFEAAYDPRGARELYAAADAVRTTVERDESAEVDRGRLADLDRATAEYTRRYLAYWCVRVPEEARAGLPGTWDACFSALGHLSARDINASLGGLSERILDAIGSAPEGLVAQDASSVELKALLEQDMPRLLAPRQLNVESQAVIENWRLLSPRAGSAREDILRMSPGRLLTQLVYQYQDGGAQSPGMAYWSDVQYGSLVALATSAEDQAREARDRLAVEARGFPLCLDCERVLTGAEVDEAARMVAMLDLPAGGRDGSRNTIGDGEMGALPTRVQEQLKRVRGDFVWASVAQRRWFERVRGAVAPLADADDRLEQELVLLRRQSQDDQAIGSRYPTLEVWLGARRLLISGERTASTDRLNPSTGVRLTLPVEDVIELRFFERGGGSDNGEPSAVARLEAPWSGLGAVRKSTGPMDPDDVSPEGLPITGVWRYPLELRTPDGRPLRGAGGEPLRYVVGVRFTGASLPETTEWATQGTWAAPTP